MKVTVTGATGTLGTQLVAELVKRGDDVTVLTRSAEQAKQKLGTEVEALEWADPKGEEPPSEALATQDAIIHLLGEPIAQRWNDDVKREIRDSRVRSTRNLVTAIGELDSTLRPGVLVSQSAVGYYGRRGDERLDESAPAGDDFLADVCREWEAEAARAEELGLRVVYTRTGVVLSEEGGALEKMLPPFKAGVGGPVAGGKQYVPWIHTDDVVGALLHCADQGSVAGPVNLSAPEPVTNKELSKALGRVLHRPAIAPVPSFAIKLLYGEMSIIVTTGQRAVPKALEDAGYAFRRADLDAALKQATGKG